LFNHSVDIFNCRAKTSVWPHIVIRKKLKT